MNASKRRALARQLANAAVYRRAIQRGCVGVTGRKLDRAVLFRQAYSWLDLCRYVRALP